MAGRGMAAHCGEGKLGHLALVDGGAVSLVHWSAPSRGDPTRSTEEGVCGKALMWVSALASARRAVQIVPTG
jgi:hypothetical protein